MDWCEPRNFKDWIKRFLSLRCLTFILIVLLLAVFEFRFDWMEKALGAYLSTTNRLRPETGVIWETAHHTEQARRYLDEMMLDREEVQRDARDAGDLAAILPLVTESGSVMLSADHFRALYVNLPSRLAASIVSPAELLQLLGEKQWERTYIRRHGNRLGIYLINRSNHVLRELVVPENILVQIERGGIPFEGSLEAWGVPPGQIFPADRFFSALAYLPEDVRAEILAQPEQVLGEKGHLGRVGYLWPVQAEWIDIGFEVADGEDRRIIILPAREWALRRLIAVMGDASEAFPSILSTPEAAIPR
ncbi:MAG TPA: hypothetical protein VLL97_09650 [Acidobacteriota bacterium]|nr:hypothetical protein [Acidobacteriota bacterium]